LPTPSSLLASFPWPLRFSLWTPFFTSMLSPHLSDNPGRLLTAGGVAKFFFNPLPLSFDIFPYVAQYSPPYPPFWSSSPLFFLRSNAPVHPPKSTPMLLFFFCSLACFGRRNVNVRFSLPTLSLSRFFFSFCDTNACFCLSFAKDRDFSFPRPDSLFTATPSVTRFLCVVFFFYPLCFGGEVFLDDSIGSSFFLLPTIQVTTYTGSTFLGFTFPIVRLFSLASVFVLVSPLFKFSFCVLSPHLR